MKYGKGIVFKVVLFIEVGIKYGRLGLMVGYKM